MTDTLPRLYDDLAAWRPLLSPPDEYDAEAVHLRTAAEHCRPGETVAVLPDFVRETFAADPDHGGRVDYGFLLRAADGTVTVAHDRHVERLFAREQWLTWFAEAGLAPRRSMDPWGRDLFLGLRGEPRG